MRHLYSLHQALNLFISIILGNKNVWVISTIILLIFCKKSLSNKPHDPYHLRLKPFIEHFNLKDSTIPTI